MADAARSAAPHAPDAASVWVCPHCGSHVGDHDCPGRDAAHTQENKPESKWCLRTDRESGPLPCCKEKGHPGPCYFRW